MSQPKLWCLAKKESVFYIQEINKEPMFGGIPFFSRLSIYGSSDLVWQLTVLWRWSVRLDSMIASKPPASTALCSNFSLSSPPPNRLWKHLNLKWRLSREPDAVRFNFVSTLILVGDTKNHLREARIISSMVIFDQSGTNFSIRAMIWISP